MELRIEHLMKRYGEKVALADFSYTFTPGIYGILGKWRGQEHADESDYRQRQPGWRQHSV